MDISKLKLEKYENVKVVNFPEEFDLKIESVNNNVEVVIYYINELADVKKFVDLVKEFNLPKDNRVIMVYKKGRKDGVSRDGIILPFKEETYDNFKIRRPALCSLSKELSAFVQSYEG